MVAEPPSLRGADVRVGGEASWPERRHNRGPAGPAPSRRGLCGETIRAGQQISAVSALQSLSTLVCLLYTQNSPPPFN